jgi:hypothetical protein
MLETQALIFTCSPVTTGWINLYGVNERFKDNSELVFQKLIVVLIHLIYFVSHLPTFHAKYCDYL